MCIASGRHMSLDDWCLCPSSGMPALLSQYKKLLSGENKESPMTGQPVNPDTLKYSYDAQLELRQITARPQEESDKEEGEDEEESADN